MKTNPFYKYNKNRNMDPKEKENINEEELMSEATQDEAAENEEIQEEDVQDSAAPTEEEKLAQELEEANKVIEEQKDKYLRLSAEFDNYRKRTTKEKEEIGLTAKVKCIADLLPVLDTLERALGIGCSDEEFLRGVKLTYDKMNSILTKMGVEEIKAEGEPFNPELHYAVSRVENPDLGENVVATVMQKGYTMGGKVIRHAMVAVANP